VIASFFFITFAIAVLALIVTAALAPIETLSWWAGWTEEEIDHHAAIATPTHSDGEDRLFVVYLSGVASISGAFLAPRERAFIRRLRKNAPSAVIIDNVFPYSPSGAPLFGAPRLFERLWRRIRMLKLRGRASLLEALINIRNIYQVMISADHRYGPIYNQGAASVIEEALLKAGYHPDGDAPIFIIGYSGGGQVAIGAAPFLAHRLNASIEVIAVGGVMASDPGLHFVRRLHHIVGDGDNIQKVGAVMFPERWAAMAHSPWNVAEREGRIIRHRMDDIMHAGPRGYFGLVKFEGASNNARTLEKILAILSTHLDAPARAQ